MNLYRTLYINKHDTRLVHREKLYKQLVNLPEFTIHDLNEIRSFKGMPPLEESKFLDVKNMTKKAFSTPDMSSKFRSLTRIKGVGMGLASEILAFQNPYKYATISHKTWNLLVKNFGMRADEKKTQDDFALKDYETYMEKIRALADEHGMKPSDVEFVLNYLSDKK